jgi:hypothetical protein
MWTRPTKSGYAIARPSPIQTGASLYASNGSRSQSRDRSAGAQPVVTTTRLPLRPTTRLALYHEARDLALAAQHIDDGASGSRERRPALDALMADARGREVDPVVVTKLDRLARSVRDLCNLTADLEALGVDLVVIDQGIDTSTPLVRPSFKHWR